MNSYVLICLYLALTELPSLRSSPKVLVENSTGVFRCEAKLGGAGRETITDIHDPYLKLYFTDNPNQELPAVIRRDQENTLVKVSDQCQ